MSKAENKFYPETVRLPEYGYANSGTLIFITGAPLSGKSTIAPLVASCIERSVLQPMDIIRLMAQEIEAQKPEQERNRFVNAGSCDSYTLLEDGTYSQANLIEGFGLYCDAVGGLVSKIVPKLEAQGSQDVIFEGVQVTPPIVAPYLINNNRLIVITATSESFKRNRDKMYLGSESLLDRYSIDKLVHIQNEILSQSLDIPEDKLIVVDNSGEYIDAARQIVSSLIEDSVIVRK